MVREGRGTRFGGKVRCPRNQRLPYYYTCLYPPSDLHQKPLDHSAPSFSRNLAWPPRVGTARRTVSQRITPVLDQALYVRAGGRVVGVVGVRNYVVDIKETGGRVGSGVAIGKRIVRVEESLAVVEDGSRVRVHMARLFAGSCFFRDRRRVGTARSQFCLLVPEYILT